MSRTRPNMEPLAPGPREVKYILELSLAYSHGLQDVIAVMDETMGEFPELVPRYARLVEAMRSLVGPGEGGLQAVERECRALLGEQ